MSQGDPGRVAQAVAAGIAAEFVDLIEDTCARVMIAGSLRRQRPEVKDIEIMALPLYQHTMFDLFGEAAVTLNLLHQRLDALWVDGTLSRARDAEGRPRWGERFRKLVFQEMTVDLFMPLPDSWGYILAVRTGPAEVSKRYVTPRAQHGFLPDGYRAAGGQVLDPAGAPVALPTEADFFRLLGIPELAPEQRHTLGWN